MTFLTRLESVKHWKAAGKRAPHKPLLLLLALGRVQRGEPRLASFDTWEKGLVSLLKQFGSPRKTVHPEQPFARLCNDQVWEVPGIELLPKTTSGDVHKRSLKKQKTEGGLLESDYRCLVGSAARLQEAADLLLAGHFPESLHDEIRQAVGLRRGMVLRDSPVRTRDSGFRDKVLRNYEYRCAVCDFDIRIGDELLGLEAAHIKWHAAGGPDRAENGLALCGLHHKALDRGAWGLKRRSSGYQVMISSHVHGQSQGLQRLRSFHGQLLRAPLLPELAPDRLFVRWHAQEVFRGPPLP